MKFLLIILLICLFITCYRNGIIIESMDNDDDENDSCQKDGYANEDFNRGMQYALDKKVAQENIHDYEHMIMNSHEECFTKGYNAIYHNIDTGKLFQ